MISGLRKSLVSLVLFVGFVVFVAVDLACGMRCVPGASVRCACPDGSEASQICLASGIFGACACQGVEEVSADGGREAVLPEFRAEDRPESAPESAPESPLREGAAESAQEKAPESSGGIEGISLLTRLHGLWVGMASRTPLGSFAMTTMDLRAASPHVLFSRADLDANNSLRFAFSIETHQGRDVLIYRNGGYFLGILRDTRTSLVSYQQATSTWKFCEITRGCDYLQATFTFPSETQMVLDVKVRGRDHMFWQAERKETRTPPQPFPQDTSSQGTGDAPFPTMASAKLSLRWTTPLAQDAAVWFLLSSTSCGVSFQCNPARSIRVEVKAGATSAQIDIDQLHEGKYFMNALLDRNNNAAQIFFPDSGDGVGQLDQTLDVRIGQPNELASQVFFTLP